MHVKHLLIGGGGLLVLLLVLGVSPTTALPYAILLACPLMMVLMMRGMQGHGTGSDHNHSKDQSGREEPGTEESAPTKRLP